MRCVTCEDQNEIAAMLCHRQVPLEKGHLEALSVNILDSDHCVLEQYTLRVRIAPKFLCILPVRGRTRADDPHMLCRALRRTDSMSLQSGVMMY
jgi:hypothetical protein